MEGEGERCGKGGKGRESEGEWKRGEIEIGEVFGGINYDVTSALVRPRGVWRNDTKRIRTPPFRSCRMWHPAVASQ